MCPLRGVPGLTVLPRCQVDRSVSGGHSVVAALASFPPWSDEVEAQLGRVESELFGRHADKNTAKITRPQPLADKLRC